MESQSKVDSVSDYGGRAAMVARAAQLGLHPADSREVRAAHDLAVELIGSDIASAHTLQAAQSISMTSVLVAEDEPGLTGVLATLLLREEGRAAIEDGSFDGVELDLSLLARPDETPAAFYVWGCAARNRDAARSCIGGIAHLGGLFSSVPRFARAATEAGARSLTDSLGYRPVPEQPGLYCLPAEAAA